MSRAGGAEGAPADGASVRPRLSIDGRYVAFTSDAGNLSDQDGPAVDVFARDTVDQRTALVSRATGASGAAADGGSFGEVISSDGLHVVFLSDADNLSADGQQRLPQPLHPRARPRPAGAGGRSRTSVTTTTATTAGPTLTQEPITPPAAMRRVTRAVAAMGTPPATCGCAAASCSPPGPRT